MERGQLIAASQLPPIYFARASQPSSSARRQFSGVTHTRRCYAAASFLPSPAPAAAPRGRQCLCCRRAGFGDARSAADTSRRADSRRNHSAGYDDGQLRRGLPNIDALIDAARAGHAAMPSLSGVKYASGRAWARAAAVARREFSMGVSSIAAKQPREPIGLAGQAAPISRHADDEPSSASAGLNAARSPRHDNASCARQPDGRFHQFRGSQQSRIISNFSFRASRYH